MFTWYYLQEHFVGAIEISVTASLPSRTIFISTKSLSKCTILHSSVLQIDFSTDFPLHYQKIKPPVCFPQKYPNTRCPIILENTISWQRECFLLQISHVWNGTPSKRLQISTSMKCRQSEWFGVLCLWIGFWWDHTSNEESGHSECWTNFLALMTRFFEVLNRDCVFRTVFVRRTEGHFGVETLSELAYEVIQRHSWPSNSLHRATIKWCIGRIWIRAREHVLIDLAVEFSFVFWFIVIFHYEDRLFICIKEFLI